MSPLTIQPSFAAGELAPSLWARVDLAKYHVGAKTMRNFFVLASGGAANRPGTQFVAQVKDTTHPVRLIPFQFNTSQTYVLEFGHQYMRVIVNGGLVLNPDGSVYVMGTPYAGADLALLKFTQSADVMTICHPNYAPRDLSRTAPNGWTLNTITFAPQIGSPGGLTLKATNPGNGYYYGYVVTAISATNAEEGLPCAPVIVQSSQLNQNTGVSIQLTWNGVGNAASYRIYKANPVSTSSSLGGIPNGAMYGYIGTATGTGFVDTNIGSDFTQTPPQGQNPFGNNNNPGCVTYFQQRKVFAGSPPFPETMWMSQPGAFYNMDTTNPSLSTDAITITINSRQVNAIKHLVSVNALLALTASGAFKISGGSQGAAITPSQISATPQAYNGCSDAPPIIINNDILYVSAMGGCVRDLSYNFYADIYTGSDMTVLSPHLFFGHQILDWAYAAEPFNMVWAVREDGILLGFTYLKEQDIYAWTRHDTQGSFLAVACVAEGAEDATYVVVSRTIPGVNNGNPVQYIERFHSRNFMTGGVADVTKAWFVDCGLQYAGTPVATVSGLNHLNGANVVALADGNVISSLTVVNGQVTLPHPAATITVGLPYSADLQTLDLEIAAPTMQGRRKKISAVTVRLENSRGLKVGYGSANLAEIKERTNQAYGQAIPLTTGDERIIIPPDWNASGDLWVRQDNPLPATVLALIPEVNLGNH